jgi:hypothetical protein
MVDAQSSAPDLGKDLLATILSARPGRQVSVPEGIAWGELILPAPDETPVKTPGGLRVLGICSWTLGFLAFETMKLVARKLPSRLDIVGLVTDDPVDPSAKISLARRFWRYYTPPEREEYERGILESALASGIPCFTGQVKCDGFRKLLASWDPDVIVVAGFGQLMDPPILDYPRLGIYNVHPADLLHGHGAGPQPWEDLVARKAATARVTIHRVSEVIDSGSVVGESPLISIRLKDGTLTDDVRMIGEKTLLPVDHMVAELLLEILRRKDSGVAGSVDHIDFGRLFSPDFRKRLMEPIDPEKRGAILPLPSDEIRFTV